MTWSEAKRWECGHCGFVYYHNMAAAVAAVLMCGHEILLSVRKHNPAQGMLDLPGGFVDYHESLEQALSREVEEELGLVLECSEWRYLFSFPNRYEFAGITYLTADAFFLAELETKPRITADDDVAGEVWIELDQVDPERIGLESIRNAIRELQQRYRQGRLPTD
ncbi:MAG: NUDIX domain-containing protein [Candidatus Thiodiazotropha sp.]